MKYIYTMYMALSSFFTYNSISANTHTYQNAFFIPGGAFQQNTSVKEIPIKRVPQTQPTQTKQPTIKQLAAPTYKATTALTQETPHTTKNNTSPQKQTKQSPKKTTQQKAKQIAVPKKQQNTPKKTAKYKLEDSITTPQKTKTVTVSEISPLEKFQQQTLKEMLNTLPYPDFNLPKYKQIYALYALELRSAYRRGKLPTNNEQEEILAKANSIRRFEIK